MSTSDRSARILLVVSRGRTTSARRDRLARQREGAEPRTLLWAEYLGADILDEESIGEVGGQYGQFLRWLPPFIAQAVEALRRADDYDVVLSWSEKQSVALAGLSALRRRPIDHIMMTSLISQPSVRVPLRILRRGVSGIITWSSVQRSVAIGLGFSPKDVHFVPHPVDTAFFVPRVGSGTGILAAGSTMRDFDTLVEATEGLDVPVRIAASWVVRLGGWRAKATDVRQTLNHSDTVEVVQLDAAKLRDAYAAASVVVVPLIPSDMDNGVNVILEGMASGRPVIASKTSGQVDVIVEGVTGHFVPPGAPAALRRKIEEVLANEAESRELAARARAYVEKFHTVEDFARNIRQVVEQRSLSQSTVYLGSEAAGFEQ